MKISESKYKANKKWDRENTQRVSFDVKMGDREKLQLYCASIDKSVNQYLKDLINADLAANGYDLHLD